MPTRWPRFSGPSSGLALLQPGVDEDAVAGLDADPLRLLGGIEIGGIHALVRCQPWDAARGRDVEQHSAREDAVLLREHVAEREPARQRDLGRLAAVVDVLAAIDVGDRVEVRQREAVHVERQRIDRTDRVMRLVAHRVPHRRRIVGRLQGVEVARERQRPAGADQRRRGEALRVRDVVERAELVVLAPAPGIVDLVEQRVELGFRWKLSLLGHGCPLPRGLVSLTTDVIVARAVERVDDLQRGEVVPAVRQRHAARGHRLEQRRPSDR